MRNKKPASSLICNGARGTGLLEREENDFYATDPKAIKELLKCEEFNKDVWECACGAGHLAKVLREEGCNVLATDIVDRGYGDKCLDFLKYEGEWKGDIITNPPYKYAKQFVEKALDVVSVGNRVAMFLKLTFLESYGRRKLFEEYPPKYIYVSSGRINCAMNGDFEKNRGTAMAFAWYIWEKGYKGEPIIRWFN